jgi:chromosome segregation ATPase
LRLRERLAAEMGALEAEFGGRVQRLIEPMERARESLEATIDQFERRAGSVREQLVADGARLTELASSVEQTLSRTQARSEAAELIAVRVAECAARAESVQSSIESTITEAGVRLGAGLTQAERRAADISAHLAGELDSVNSALGALHAEVEAARAVKAPKVPDTEQLEKLGEWLRQLIAQGDKIGRGLSVLIQRSGG